MTTSMRDMASRTSRSRDSARRCDSVAASFHARSASWQNPRTREVADGRDGTLDLGLVRDSTLNATNDYQVFSESWECVVPKVIESLKITSTLCTTGAGATDASSSAYCTAS